MLKCRELGQRVKGHLSFHCEFSGVWDSVCAPLVAQAEAVCQSDCSAVTSSLIRVFHSVPSHCKKKGSQHT